MTLSLVLSYDHKSTSFRFIPRLGTFKYPGDPYSDSQLVGLAGVSQAFLRAQSERASVQDLHQSGCNQPWARSHGRSAIPTKFGFDQVKIGSRSGGDQVEIGWRSGRDRVEIGWRSGGDRVEIGWRSDGDRVEIGWRSGGDRVKEPQSKRNDDIEDTAPDF